MLLLDFHYQFLHLSSSVFLVNVLLRIEFRRVDNRGLHLVLVIQPLSNHKEHNLNFSLMSEANIKMYIQYKNIL